MRSPSPQAQQHLDMGPTMHYTTPEPSGMQLQGPVLVFVLPQRSTPTFFPSSFQHPLRSQPCHSKCCLCPSTLPPLHASQLHVTAHTLLHLAHCLPQLPFLPSAFPLLFSPAHFQSLWPCSLTSGPFLLDFLLNDALFFFLLDFNGF